MTHFVESEDYSMYAFPALKALEGHIKYLISEAGGNAGRQFSCFGMDKTVIPNRYVVTESFPDRSKNRLIENCYNYYISVVVNYQIILLKFPCKSDSVNVYFYN